MPASINDKYRGGRLPIGRVTIDKGGPKICVSFLLIREVVH
jgi:hypothetical protein